MFETRTWPAKRRARVSISDGSFGALVCVFLISSIAKYIYIENRSRLLCFRLEKLNDIKSRSSGGRGFQKKRKRDVELSNQNTYTIQ